MAIYWIAAIMTGFLCVVKIYEHKPGWLAEASYLAALTILLWSLATGRLMWTGK